MKKIESVVLKTEIGGAKGEGELKDEDVESLVSVKQRCLMREVNRRFWHIVFKMLKQVKFGRI